MKTRDSGMPDEAWWQSFFDPDAILDRLGLDEIHGPVVDVGCGYGTFALTVARRSRHPVIALDIDAEMVARTAAKAVASGFTHLDARAIDVTVGSWGLAPGSVDVVLLFNILHCEDPMSLLTAARSVLRAEGRVAIIHWRSDVPTPRGPDLSIRPRPESMVDWLKEAGFHIERGPVVLPPYHFGVVGHATLG